MIVQIIDCNGKAIRRRHFFKLYRAYEWVNLYQDEIDRMNYSVEIFYD